VATHEEKVCAAIVCDVLGGRWTRVPEHSHDFDLSFEDGREEYLEISAFTDQDVEGRWHRHPAPRQSSVLSGWWTLHVTRDANLNTVQSEAGPHLATLEELGRQSYFSGDHYTLLFQLEPNPAPNVEPTHPLVIASLALARLGVQDAVSLTSIEETGIDVAQSVSTVGSPTELLNSAVKSVATKPDNIAKLTSTVAAKTHLFVPIRIPGGGVWSVVQQGPPRDPPDGLDPAIGRIWVLGRGEQVLFIDYGSNWQAAEFDPRVFTKPEEWEKSQRMDEPPSERTMK
jgi:hypothetical protein